jgi:phosphatidylserine decarboxylase
VPERHSLIDTIADQITPVHADGYKFLALAAAITLFFFLLWPPLGWLGALVTAWIAYFFRDPPRVTPLREGLVLAPGDGKICAIERLRPPSELGLGDTERLRISIFVGF